MIRCRVVPPAIKCQVTGCRSTATIETTFGQSTLPRGDAPVTLDSQPFERPATLYLCTDHAADLSVKLEETTADLSQEHKQ